MPRPAPKGSPRERSQGLLCPKDSFGGGSLPHSKGMPLALDKAWENMI